MDAQVAAMEQKRTALAQSVDTAVAELQAQLDAYGECRVMCHRLLYTAYGTAQHVLLSYCMAELLSLSPSTHSTVPRLTERHSAGPISVASLLM